MIDFIFKNGQLTLSDSLSGEVNDILVAKKGHLKFTPLIGVGIYDFVDDAIGQEELFSRVASELKKDNKRLTKARFVGDIYITTVKRI